MKPASTLVLVPLLFSCWFVSVNLFGRQVAGISQYWQNADAVVVWHPLAEDQWSFFLRKERYPQMFQIVEHGAAAIAVNFKYLNLMFGDKVVVRDSANSSLVTITTANASDLTQSTATYELSRSLLLRTHPLMIRGDTVIVEYFPCIPTLMRPLVASLHEKPVVVLDSYVSVSYSATSGLPNARTETESTVGAIDEAKEAICFRKTQPKMYEKARAVARLMIRNEQEQASIASAQAASWVFCTGWLVGKDNHLMTNYHCLKDAAVLYRHNTSNLGRNKREVVSSNAHTNRANQFWHDNTSSRQKTDRVLETVVGFMAETKCCREVGYMKKVGIVEATQVRVIAMNPELDYALVQLLTNNSTIDLAQRYGYLRLCATGPVDGESIYIPQHPRGEPKEIAAVKDGKPAVMEVLPESNSINSFVSLTQKSIVSNVEPSVWYNADTEPGSSGSPVISRKGNAVVALHRAGTSDSALSASTNLLNEGVRIDLIARDLQRQRLLPRDGLVI